MAPNCKAKQLRQRVGQRRAKRLAYGLKQSSDVRIVGRLREVRDVEGRLPGNRDLDLGLVEPLLVLGEGSRDGLSLEELDRGDDETIWARTDLDLSDPAALKEGRQYFVRVRRRAHQTSKKERRTSLKILVRSSSVTSAGSRLTNTVVFSRSLRSRPRPIVSYLKDKEFYKKIDAPNERDPC